VVDDRFTTHIEVRRLVQLVPEIHNWEISWLTVRDLFCCCNSRGVQEERHTRNRQSATYPHYDNLRRCASWIEIF